MRAKTWYSDMTDGQSGINLCHYTAFCLFRIPILALLMADHTF
ncbi:hypothetical protein [Moraxella lacunata]